MNNCKRGSMRCLYATIFIFLLPLSTFAETQAVMALSRKDNTTLQHIDVAKKHIEQGKYQDALAILKMIEPTRYNALEDFTKGSLFGAYFNVGTQCLRESDYALAIGAYQQAKGVTPDDFRVHYSLGICYRKTEKYDASIGAFTKAIELNPEFSSAYYNLGSTYWKLKDYDKSREAFQTVLKLDPTHVPAQYMIGLAAWYQRDYKGAAHAWDRVLQMDPKHKKAKKKLSDARLMIGPG
jgi:tetratricopeptide (TPR) repeat protein